MSCIGGVVAALLFCLVEVCCCSWAVVGLVVDCFVVFLVFLVFLVVEGIEVEILEEDEVCKNIMLNVKRKK